MNLDLCGHGLIRARDLAGGSIAAGEVLTVNPSA
jgi:hypothetical protein